MPSFIRNITFDCADPVLLADFWEAALGFTERNAHDDEVLLAQKDWPFPRLSFQRVPEGKAGKNRVHLDITPADMSAEVERLTGLGATTVRLFPAEETGSIAWTVMRDPEGNEFCVTEAGD